MHKGSTQTNKNIKERVQKERSKETQVCPGLAHCTVRCVTGQCQVHQDHTTLN
jgi:predicted Zn-dependent protease